MAQPALGAHDVEEWIIVARRGCEFLIDGREQADVGAMHVPGELHRGDRLHDATRVNEVLRNLKQLAPFQEERPFLGKEQRLAWIERELAGIRFDL